MHLFIVIFTIELEFGTSGIVTIPPLYLA